MPEKKSHIALSIAGFDPSAGAGVLADIQTMQGCEVNGMAVLTSVTSQNEVQITNIKWLDFKQIKSQLDPLLAMYSFDVVKIGVVKNLQVLDHITDYLLKHNSKIRIIWDPILRSSSGTELMEGLDHEMLAKLMNKLFLVTPNLGEYEKLKDQIGTDFRTNILVKGGHSKSDNTTDQLIIGSAEPLPIPGQRIPEADKHGTGCVLTSAIASGLVRGMKLKTACIFGKRYVEGYLRSGVNKLGAHYEIEI